MNLSQTIKQEKEKLQKGYIKPIKGISANRPNRKEIAIRCNLCNKILSGTTGKQRWVKNLWCTNCFRLYHDSPLQFLKQAKLQTLSDIEAQIKEKVGELKFKVNTHSSHRVINGKAPKHDIELFQHAEEIGREQERELALELITEIMGDFE